MDRKKRLPPLYKYLSVYGTQLTLGNKTFRHAKPSDFNDLEDLTIQSIFPEEIEIALERLSRCFHEVFLQHINDPPTCNSPLREKVAFLQEVYRQNPDAAEIVRKELEKEDHNEIYDTERMRALAENTIAEVNEFLQEYRVLCVTTSKDSDAMWDQYAEGHKGFALRIEPNYDKGSKFQLFRPVVYKEKRPPLYENTRDFISGSLFGDQMATKKSMIRRIIYTKTLAYEFENEYRLSIPIRQGEAPWDTLPYHPEEVTELFIGLSTEVDTRSEIVELARSVNPNIRIYQAIRAGDGGLAFEKYGQIAD